MSPNSNPTPAPHALVFLHHYGGSSRSWREVIARLPGCVCFAPDQRGFGEASDPPANWSVDEAAADIASRIEAQGLGDYTLVGHSMGGKIALALAARLPQGLERLVLLAPSPPSPEPMSDDVRKQLLDGFGLRAAAEQTVSDITARPLSPELRELAVEDILRSKPNAWRAWLDRGSREDISARMNRISIPVLVVAGAGDEAMTPEVLQREVVELLANARLHTVEGAAHLLPLEAPETVVSFIRGAL